MVEAVIFDIDGTIVDSVDLHMKAWKAALEKFGKNISFDEIRLQIGKGEDQIISVFFSKEEAEDVAEEIEKYRSNLFRNEYLPIVKAFPRVRQLFERIKQDHKVIELASSAKKDELEIYKRIAAIGDLVDFETASNEAKRSKPFPDIFQAALKKLDHIQPERVIAIGDTRYDAEAAAKANLRTVGFLSGGSTEEELRQAGCVALYRNPADLLERYEESPLVK